MLFDQRDESTFGTWGEVTRTTNAIKLQSLRWNVTMLLGEETRGTRVAAMIVFSMRTNELLKAVVLLGFYDGGLPSENLSESCT